MDKKTEQCAVHMPAQTKIAITGLAEQIGMTNSEWILNCVHERLQSEKAKLSVLNNWNADTGND